MLTGGRRKHSRNNPTEMTSCGISFSLGRNTDGRDYGGTNPAQGSVNRDWCSQSENGMKLKRRKLKAPLTDRSEIKLIN